MSKSKKYKTVPFYKELKVGDRVMKKSGKPFLFNSDYAGYKETYLFSGFISKIIVNNNHISFSVKNGKFHIGGLHYNDIELIDKAKISNIIKIWRSINRLAESICYDFRFSCFTNYTIAPKEKQKYKNLLQAFLAAFSLQFKNRDKKYVVYKCSNCNFYHVGGDLNNESINLIEQNVLPLVGLS